MDLSQLPKLCKSAESYRAPVVMMNSSDYCKFFWINKSHNGDTTKPHSLFATVYAENGVTKYKTDVVTVTERVGTNGRPIRSHSVSELNSEGEFVEMIVAYLNAEVK